MKRGEEEGSEKSRLESVKPVGRVEYDSNDMEYGFHTPFKMNWVFFFNTMLA